MSKQVVDLGDSEMDLSPPLTRDIWRKAVLIRLFEQTLLDLYAKGELSGTVHTCIGQEFTGVAIAEALRVGDFVISNHRGHGHYLATHEDVVGLLSEIFGKQTGVSRGVGGSQHTIGSNFLSNGIQGGMIPVALGIGLSFKISESQNIVTAFIGDGTLGEGILYECLNIASKWSIPIAIVVENNGYAQSTSSTQTISGTIEGRSKAFDIRYFNGNTWDPSDLLEKSKTVLDYVRNFQKPALLEVNTYRLKAHSKGDDNRDREEIERFWSLDPISRLEKSEPEFYLALSREARGVIGHAVEEAQKAPIAAYRPKPIQISEKVEWSSSVFAKKRHVDLIYDALKWGFDEYPEMMMIGEDIEGPYGGAFKVSKDLSRLFPARVRNTPISEAAIVGTATGLALQGRKAIVEIMFGDFLTLTFDQLFQHAAKFHDMYGGQCQVPLIVRTPMGGKRGYGPTHSQSIEKFFLGIPGLTVLAVNNRYSPYELYKTIIAELASPMLVIENKILYTRFLEDTDLRGFQVEFSGELFPTVKISPSMERPHVSIICYGGTLEDAENAIGVLFDEDEILCEIICPTQLYPLNIFPIAESVRKTEYVLIVEEGASFAGFGSEVLGQICEAGIQIKGARRLGYDGIVPACMPVELDLLPSAAAIIREVRMMLDD